SSAGAGSRRNGAPPRTIVAPSSTASPGRDAAASSRRLRRGVASPPPCPSSSTWADGGPMLSDLWSELRYRLRAILRSHDVDRELDEEVRFHLERETEKLIAAGAAPGEARRQARLAFGGVERVKEESRSG